MRNAGVTLLISMLVTSACVVHSPRSAPQDFVGVSRDILIREYGKPARESVDPESGLPLLVYWDRRVPTTPDRWSVRGPTNPVDPPLPADDAAYFTVTFEINERGYVAAYALSDEKPHWRGDGLPGPPAQAH